MSDNLVTDPYKNSMMLVFDCWSTVQNVANADEKIGKLIKIDRFHN